MRILPALLASAACALLTIACSSDDDGGFTDGNTDPQRAECETKVVMSCISTSGTCHEWYSEEAADAIYSTCVQLNQVISNQPCPTRYSECCIHIEGSYDYPEGICLSDTDPDLAGFKSRCESTQDHPERWCGG
ncbi:MAG: hypothetical protein H6718_21135 [Polyangiaceae bacterium]|nr:hypothetical protein [Polyangiaceae bacterium]